MLHARSRGETFGIAVGEFAIANKWVYTYWDSPEKAHIQMLGKFALPYQSEFDLAATLCDELPLRAPGATKYHECTPEKVMAKFKEVFLD
jgi:hypothetical protein